MSEEDTIPRIPNNLTDVVNDIEMGITNKEQPTILNTPWNYRIKILLKKIGEKSMGYRWMHEQESIYYKRIDYWVGVMQIVITAILTLLSSGTLILLLTETNSNNNLTSKLTLTLIELFLTLLLNIINGVQNHSDYKGVSKKHLQSSFNFIRIYHTIQEQLTLPVLQRENDHEFLQEKIKEYDDLVLEAPEIQKKIRDEYLTATKDHSIFKPSILGDIENIEIDDNIERQNTDSEYQNELNQYKFQIDRFIHNF
ncbi:MAG: hypothetical protein CMF62_02595 [Magnetococcales bacterium]|nr:hypothetical protein [Magnetococcales bacterium]|tara:strand:+ start:71363 stop:72124 length:762 start_codon:yes stop_codon:yes gene_type:complete